MNTPIKPVSEWEKFVNTRVPGPVLLVLIYPFCFILGAAVGNSLWAGGAGLVLGVFLSFIIANAARKGAGENPEVSSRPLEGNEAKRVYFHITTNDGQVLFTTSLISGTPEDALAELQREVARRNIIATCVLATREEYLAYKHGRDSHFEPKETT